MLSFSLLISFENYMHIRNFIIMKTATRTSYSFCRAVCLTTLLCLAIAVLPCAAQRVSLLGGFTTSNVKMYYQDQKMVTKDRLGYHAGVMTQVKFGKQDKSSLPKPYISIDPSLLYIQKGYDRKEFSGTGFEISNQFNYLQLSLPLMGNVGNSRFKLGIGLGPYVGYALSGTHTREDIYSERVVTELKFGSSDGDHFEALDYGAIAAVDLRLWYIKFVLQYYRGMNNINPSQYEGSIKNNGFSVSAGICF